MFSFHEPDSIDETMRRVLWDASVQMSLAPLDAAMHLWVETVKDVRDAHLQLLEAQRMYMRFCFPWLQ